MIIRDRLAKPCYQFFDCWEISNTCQKLEFTTFPFTHALRNDLPRSGRRDIYKMHEKKGFKQVLEQADGVLGFSKQIAPLKRGKMIKN